MKKVMAKRPVAKPRSIRVGLDIPDGIEQWVRAVTLSFAMKKVMTKRPVAKPGGVRVGLDIPNGIEEPLERVPKTRCA
jgi:hypothetical protein